jgi:HD-GYP domain-containing protein (c-di-GMP phosphodiesterase class II)
MITDALKTKCISLSDLRPGMYVLELDQPWIKTPFLRHRFLVQNTEQIDTLRQASVRQVVIDPSRGLDVENAEDSGNLKAARRRAQNETAKPVPPYPADFKEAGEVARETSREVVRAARAIRNDAVTSIRNLFSGTKTGIPLEAPALKGVVRCLVLNLLEHPAATTIMMHLEGMQQTHRCVYEHAVDVCVMSMMIGRAHRLRPHEIDHLGLGALMHDLGEIDLPGHLQRPAGRFTEQEEALFREHPRRGNAILSRSTGVPEPVHRIVWEHHERVDGSGYPYGLHGSQISLLSQIVGLADQYDGMVTRRDGRRQLSGAEAMRQLYQSGIDGRFDQSLVERMIECLGVYPVGSLVALNTGERAWVIAGDTQNRLKPWVKLVWDRRGAQRYTSEIVDLSSPRPGEPERKITQVLSPHQESVDCFSILAY